MDTLKMKIGLLKSENKEASEKMAKAEKVYHGANKKVLKNKLRSFSGQSRSRGEDPSG